MLLRNKHTGEMVKVDTSAKGKSGYRFRQACKGLDRWAEANGCKVYFLTLTLRSEDAETVNKDLNKFLNFLRARFRRAKDVEQIAVADSEGGESVCTTSSGGLPMRYVWVVELQKKRYTRTGVLALHWHFAIACPAGALPDVEFRADRRVKYVVKEEGTVVTSRELWERWGRGQVLCMRTRCEGVYGYLGKYMAKDYGSLAGYKAEWVNLRRFGASRLSENAYPRWAYEVVTEKGVEYDEFLWRRRVGGKVQWYGKEDRLIVNGVRYEAMVPLVAIRSPWHVYDADEVGALT
jgi:hypothetical protein